MTGIHNTVELHELADLDINDVTYRTIDYENKTFREISREIHLFRRYTAHHAYATICLNCLKSLWQKKNCKKRELIRYKTQT